MKFQVMIFEDVIFQDIFTNQHYEFAANHTGEKLSAGMWSSLNDKVLKNE